MADKIELPKTIWLQINDDDLTWCQDMIYYDDVEYTRSDTVARLRLAIDRLLLCDIDENINIDGSAGAISFARLAIGKPLPKDLRCNK